MEKENKKEDQEITWAFERMYDNGDFTVRHEGQGLLNFQELSSDETNRYGIKGYASLIKQRDELFEQYKNDGEPCEQEKFIFNSAKTIAYLWFRKRHYWKNNYGITESETVTRLGISKKNKVTHLWSDFISWGTQEMPVYIDPIINLNNLQEDNTFVEQTINGRCFLCEVSDNENALLIGEKVKIVLEGEGKGSAQDNLLNFYKQLQIKLIGETVKDNLLRGNLAFKLLEFLNKENERQVNNDGENLRKIYKEMIGKLKFNISQTKVCFDYLDTSNRRPSQWPYKSAISFWPSTWNYAQWTQFNKLPYDNAECYFDGFDLPHCWFLVVLPNQKKATTICCELDVASDDQTTQFKIIPKEKFDECKNEQKPKEKQGWFKGWFY